METANRAFASGRYDDAAHLYQDYLRAQPSGGLRDQALFHLGLISALRPAPATDWQGAATYFKQLFEEFPDTLFKAPATLLLSLHAQLDQATTDARLRDQRMRQLTTELDRYKKIDADRRKRP
jgi:TolA-binding protein